MSAFMVSERHIDALVSLAISGPSDSESQWHQPSWRRECELREMVPGHPEYGTTTTQWVKVSSAGMPELVKDGEISGTDLGEMLWTENERSVEARYPNDHAEMLSVDYCLGYEWRYGKWSGPNPSAVQGLKLIACLDYQSCEHEGWSESEAFRFCESLRDALIGCLKGYSAAEWSL